MNDSWSLEYRFMRWEYRMGRHSGIPKCCVREFCLNRSAAEEILAAKKRYFADWHRINLCYVPCWSCLSKIRQRTIEPIQFDHICSMKARYDPRSKCSIIVARFETLVYEKRRRLGKAEHEIKTLTPLAIGEPM